MPNRHSRVHLPAPAQLVLKHGTTADNIPAYDRLAADPIVRGCTHAMSKYKSLAMSNCHRLALLFSLLLCIASVNSAPSSETRDAVPSPTSDAAQLSSTSIRNYMELICGFDCVNGACADQTGQAQKRDITSLQKRVFNNPTNWAPNTLRTFIGNQMANAEKVSLAPYNLRIQSFPLRGEPVNLVTNGLVGCISIVVLSTKRIWMSHISEAGICINLETVRETIITKEPLKVTAVYQQALRVMVAGSSGGLVGLARYMGKNQDFGPETYPEAYIIMPPRRIP